MLQQEDRYLQELVSRLDQATAQRTGQKEATMADGNAYTATAAAIAESRPAPQPARADSQAIEERLSQIRQRLTAIPVKTSTAEPAPVPATPTAKEPLPPSGSDFLPTAPQSLAAAGLRTGDIEPLVLKLLMNKCTATGREIADQVCLPFRVIDELLLQMKSDQWVVHKGAGQLGDYVYQLTDAGMDLARRIARHCSYYGAAPVPLADYIASVHQQSITHQRPTVDELSAVFADLVINTEMQERIGEAIHCGRGFFLYGAPGNGKSSVAERVARAFGQTIWIPRAIGIDGEIVRLYDPCNHVLAPGEPREGLIDAQQIDRRWVRIRRPTIIVGGELTMDRLEISPCPGMGISEAPLQMKSNCGVLVIDDFGRQRMRVEELLNRWIVPLDKQHDYLNLTSGKSIQVPFDQLLIFSTNLEPKDLVDEAFLRRIPYKIEIAGPTEDDFRALFRVEADRLGVTHSSEAVDYLIRTHYASANRAFRYCHPRDLILQVRHACTFRRRAAAMSVEAFDQAVRNYFAMIS